MTVEIGGVLLLVLVTVGLVLYWWRAVRAHQRRLDLLDVRIHVNGIRGKSTVTRLVAGVLREGGYVTVAKTTGSAARVIGPVGEEWKIKRRGAATINEQIDVVAEHVRPGVEALVIECMAVRPLYQAYAQDFMVRSDITIITNVRLDHQEEMGETLEEIADSLALTIPRGGILVTAELRPELRARLAERCAERDARLIFADPAMVTDEEMSGFDYIQFKDNVATGLVLAELLNIPRDKAVRGMWKSVPDIGVVRLRHYDIRGKDILWVPLFAANDKESVVYTMETLQPQFPEGAARIGILNNRTDRGRRAELFASMVPNELRPFFDAIVTLGAYEDSVTAAMVRQGYPRERIHNLGDTVSPTLDQLLDGIAALVPGKEGVVVGMVNIHTHQAEMLLEYFEHQAGDDFVDTIDASREPERAPDPTQRMRLQESLTATVSALREHAGPADGDADA